MEVKNHQAQIKLKESGVKSDIERMWSEWQGKLEYAENELSQCELRNNTLATEKKSLSKQLLELKKDNRGHTLEVTDLKSQITIVQERYEDIIN